MVHASRLTSITAVLFAAVCAVMAAPWVGGRGPGNRNAFPDAAFPPAPAVVWKSYLGEDYVDIVPSNTLVVADTVIVAYGRHLVAVSTETGEGRWLTTLQEAPVGDLLFLDNQIIISFAGGQVAAYNPVTGGEVWRQRLNGGIRNNPQYNDNMLMYATKSRSIQLIARRTGTPLGTLSVQEAIESSPLLMGDYFFLAFTNGEVMRIEAKTGIERWSNSIAQTVISLTPVTNGRLVLVTATQGIYAYDPFERIGGQRWSFPCGDRLQDAVTLDNDRVYVTTRTGKIYCLDLATGKNLWVPSAVVGADKERKVVEEGLQLHAAPIAAPLVVGNYLLVRMESGLMALYQKQSGMLEWVYRLAPPIGGKIPATPLIGAPALDGDHVYFAGSDGYIYHLSATTPEIDPPVFSEMLPRNNERGFVSAEGINYVGAVISDEGSGLRPAKITMKLDNADLTSKIGFDARSGYFFVWLPQEMSLAMGMHRLELSAQDSKGNIGSVSQAFIVAPHTSPEIVPITIGGEFLPKHLKVTEGTVIVWTNTSGSPRTIISDLMENGKPLFSSDEQYPQGIPNGESWVWIVPPDTELDTAFYYHCRLNGEAGDGTKFGAGLAGLIEIAEPVTEGQNETPADNPDAPVEPDPFASPQ